MDRMRERRILTACALALVAACATNHGAAQSPTPRRTIQWGTRTPAPTPAAAPTAAAGAATPSTVYVSVSRAPIREDESAAGRILGEVTKGTALRVLGTSGQRLKVEGPNRMVGFIVKLNTSASQPKQDDAGFSDLLKSSRGGNEGASGGSIRGIRAPRNPGVPEAPAEALSNARDIAASVTDADVKAFMLEGKVTPP